MITACNHCGSRYQLPDKMLGRQARCKACGKPFLIADAGGDEDEVRPPRPGGSTAELHPVSRREADAADDPLDALASAAADDPPPMHAPRPRAAPDRDEDERYARPAPTRKARGALAALSLGIIGCVLGVAALVCAIITMVQSSDQDLLVVLGSIAIALTVISTLLAMLAVVNGTSAARKIRRARHPLAGRGQASAGTILGGVTLVIMLGLVVAGSAWLVNRGGITFENLVTENANP